ncbi:MAG: hypothetical protein PVF45_04325, partial [Anaerolineae bacterium]
RQIKDYLLDFAAMHIRYFTNHGRKHFLGVIQQMSDLLSDQVLDTLSSTEILILPCCAWLHDVGLMNNVDRSGRLLDDDEIAGYQTRWDLMPHDSSAAIQSEVWNGFGARPAIGITNYCGESRREKKMIPKVQRGSQ